MSAAGAKSCERLATPGEARATGHGGSRGVQGSRYRLAVLSPHEPWVDHAPVPFGVVRNGRFVYGNRALLELLGVSLETFLAMGLGDAVAPEDRERVLGRHARRLANEPVPSSYRVGLLRSDGSRRDVEIFVSRRGEDVLFQMIDHTADAARQAHVRAIARLGATLHSHRSEAAVMRAAREGLVALGLSVVRIEPVEGDRMRIVDFSLADATVAGRFESTTGRPIAGLTTTRGPAFDACWRTGSAYVDDAPLAAIRFVGPEAAENVQHLGHDARLARMVLLRIDKGGAPDHVLAVLGDWLLPDDLAALELFGAQIASALDAATVIDDLSSRNTELAALNHVAGAAGSTSDLSSLFEGAVEEIGSLFESPAVGVNLIDEERQEAVAVRWVGANQPPEHVLRVPLAGSLLGVVAREGASRVWSVEDYTPPHRKMLEQMGLRVVVSVPLRARAKVVGIMNVGFPTDAPVPPRRIEVLENMAAHLAAAIEANRLVDDLRQSYQRLSRAQEQLVERERLAALGELAAAVAHEVRNPLGVIFNSLGSLKKLLGSDAKAETLFAILEEESVRINHIVTDLLDFTRPAFPSLRAGSLVAVIDEAVDAAQAQAPARVRFVREIDASLETPMDPRLLRQAIFNVLQNASQAMPSGGTVTIRAAAARRGERDMARLEIRDDGCGIESVHLPRIFEPFFTTRATGTGLGLAIVKRVVDGHHGSIEVESAPGAGSAFVIWLELADESF